MLSMAVPSSTASRVTVNTVTIASSCLTTPRRFLCRQIPGFLPTALRLVIEALRASRLLVRREGHRDLAASGRGGTHVDRVDHQFGDDHAF